MVSDLCVQVVSHIFCPQQGGGCDLFLLLPSVLRTPKGGRGDVFVFFRGLAEVPAALYAEIKAAYPLFVAVPPFQLLLVMVTISSIRVHGHFHLSPFVLREF